MAFSFKELFKKEDHDIVHDTRKLSFNPIAEDQALPARVHKDTTKEVADNSSPFELVEENSQAIKKESTESNTHYFYKDPVSNHDMKENGTGLNFSDEPSEDPPFSWFHDSVQKEQSDMEMPFLEQSTDKEVQKISGANNSADFFLSESEIDNNFSFIKEESSDQSRGNGFWPLGEAESSKLKKTALRPLEELNPISRNVEQKPLPPFLLDDGQINYKYILDQIRDMPGIKECGVTHGNEGSIVLSEPSGSSEYFNESFIAGVRSFRAQFGLMDENPLTINYKRDRLSFFEHNDLFIGILHGPDELESDVERKILNLLTQIAKTAKV